jgi:Methyltransferase domain
MNTSPPRCHDCGWREIHVFSRYAFLGRVTSDCKPWHAGGSLQVCRSCGLIQANADDQWRAECSEIYAAYESNYQSGGVDQAIFDPLTGIAIQRSEKLLLELLRRGLLPVAGSLVDIGCGSGGFLRACSVHLPDWDLFGLESAATYEREVRGIRGVRDFFPFGFDRLTGTYSLITLLHVFEHLEAPSAAFRVLELSLAENGAIFIEVPSCESNPFELLVADHASHFTADQLCRMMQAMGAPLLHGSDCDWIPKEISLMAGRTKQDRRSCRSPGEIESIIRLVDRQIEWLESVASGAKQLAARGRRFGVFGTSIAANWLTGIVGPDAIDFYVDEDPSRIGRSHFDKPILAPAQVRPNAKVYIPLAPVVAKAVCKRLSASGVELVLP